MKSTIFNLTAGQLREIAEDFQRKIEVGLAKDNTEILCIPTYISPKKDAADEKVMVLDWGGSYFRAAIIAFNSGQPAILESLKKPLSKDETEGFSHKELFREMADLVSRLTLLDSHVKRIGYCFSYPTESALNGDAKLIRWTKEINIPDMVGTYVGAPLLDYLNSHEGIREKTKFESINVFNDTVACLFAGLAEKGYDTYIGLIVGTGTNMAALIRLDQISKLSNDYTDTAPLPVNLESGNLVPSPHTPLVDGKYLTEIDKKADENSNNKGRQIFEKAISGRYLGELFKHSFPDDKIAADFDAEKLTYIFNNAEKYSADYVSIATGIYARSAHLVAASIAGLIKVLATSGDAIKTVCVAAEGGLFWGDEKYHRLVLEKINTLLGELKMASIRVKIVKLKDANFIGSAIASLS